MTLFHARLRMLAVAFVVLGTFIGVRNFSFILSYCKSLRALVLAIWLWMLAIL